MNTLIIPFLAGADLHTDAEGLMDAVAPLVANELKEVPWIAFPYRPAVHFKIAHTVAGILLSFDVREKHVKAVYRNTNDPVYKDSCVEFFLSFDGSNYYNLEFNCLGTALAGYGPVQKTARKRLSPETIGQVRRYCSLTAEAVETGDATEWRLLLHIPFAVFEAHEIDTLSGVRCTGNFYKCGDNLPEPHFVAWNHINSPIPDFHLPQYFGKLIFQ